MGRQTSQGARTSPSGAEPWLDSGSEIPAKSRTRLFLPCPEVRLVLASWGPVYSDEPGAIPWHLWDPTAVWSSLTPAWSSWPRASHEKTPNTGLKVHPSSTRHVSSSRGSPA